MPDIAGAFAAIRSRLATAWTTTPIVIMGKDKPDAWSTAWPPVNGSGVLLPWVLVEVICDAAPIVGTGQTGAHRYRYEGVIAVHIFTPVGDDPAVGEGYAVTIGEIFRRKEFYNATPGYAVRTEDPYPSGNRDKSDDGKYWGQTLTVGFTYWHLG